MKLSWLIVLGLLPAGAAWAETPPGTWDRVADPQAQARYELHLNVAQRLAAHETVVELRTDYQGEVVERVQGDHLSIRVTSGAVKTFAWSEIVRLVDRIDGVLVRLKPREYRGGLVEDVPNDHVTFTTAKGELK